jgi:hypothetical protein
MVLMGSRPAFHAKAVRSPLIFGGSYCVAAPVLRQVGQGADFGRGTLSLSLSLPLTPENPLRGRRATG